MGGEGRAEQGGQSPPTAKHPVFGLAGLYLGSSVTLVSTPARTKEEDCGSRCCCLGSPFVQIGAVLGLLECLQIVCGPPREVPAPRTPRHVWDAGCASPRLISSAARTPRSSFQTSSAGGVGTSSSGKSTPANP